MNIITNYSYHGYLPPEDVPVDVSASLLFFVNIHFSGGQILLMLKTEVADRPEMDNQKRESLQVQQLRT